jgi:hypothetical protein
MKKIFTDEELHEREIDPNGKALTWVIEEECLYDEAVPGDLLPIFEEHDQAIDVSNEYLDHDGIVVRFIKDQEILADFKTSEYFGSVLLSNPDVVDLSKYPYGRYVMGANAKFDGNQFILLNRDMTDLMPWYTE